MERLLRIVFVLGLYAAPPAHAEEPWRAPKEAQARRNPLPPSAAQLGATLFASYCATCHGATGRGDGMAAAALNPRPRDLASAVVQKESDGALFWKLTTGRGAMPAWQGVSERERWALVWFMRSLARATGSAGKSAPPASANTER